MSLRAGLILAQQMALHTAITASGMKFVIVGNDGVFGLEPMHKLKTLSSLYISNIFYRCTILLIQTVT